MLLWCKIVLRMWWPRLLACLLLFGLKACSPVLAPLNSDVRAKLKTVKVERMLDRPGQYMWLQLIRHLSPDVKNPNYRLHVTLKTSKEPFGLTLEGVAFRYRVTTHLTYELKDANGRTCRKKSLFVHGSYNVVENDFFAVTSVENMTTEANIDRLVGDLMFDLVAYFESQPTT